MHKFPTYAVAALLVVVCVGQAVRLYRWWRLHLALKGLQRVEQSLAEVREALENSLATNNPSFKENVELLVSSSPVMSSNVSSSVVTGEFSILKGQIEELRLRVEHSKSEIIEVQQIDPILEATLKYAVEHLTKRVDTLEKQSLTKWDVVVVVFQVLTPTVALLGLALAIIKYLHP
jgi:hypothetical protein